MKTYKLNNGTSFDERTPDEVIRVLENARQNRTRLHISLGDQQTGRDWLEEFETHGYVARSMGPMKVPLLVANRRSLGGGAILDHCIVRIRESAGGRVLYRHPDYHHGTLEIRQKTVESFGLKSCRTAMNRQRSRTWPRQGGTSRSSVFVPRLLFESK